MSGRILVADDDKLSLKLMETSLAPSNYELTLVQNGEEALDLVSKVSPDVILLDMMLPGLDALQVTKRLKSDEGTRAIPIVMMVPLQDMTEDPLRALEAGADDFLCKPINQIELQTRVRTLLKVKAHNEQTGIRLAESQTVEQKQDEEVPAYQANLLQQVSEAVIATDLELRVTSWNQAATQMYGWQEHEVMGRNLDGVLKTQFHDAAQEQADKELTDEGYWHGEITQQHKDGTMLDVMAAVSQIWDTDGEPAGRVTVNRDITEFKAVQEHALAQERQAAVGQLAAGIAHDFSQILSNIMEHAELTLMKTGLPEDVERAVRTILQQGGRATQIIRQMLDFSRKSIIERRPLDLVPLLKETFKRLQQNIPENIHIQLDTAADGHVVQADPLQIQQLVANLAANARDAMPQGGELRIGLTQTSIGSTRPNTLTKLFPGNWVIISVSDTGVGIPRDAIPHLYEPFFTTRQAGEGVGLGLGLAQAYGIVRQHDGSIDVDTEMGKGSTFRIYLPVHEGEPSQPDANETHGPGQKAETVLVVEDDTMVLGVTTSMLEFLGYRGIAASSAQEALDIYRTHQDSIFLVLADVVMPGMTGIELCQRLHESNPSLKFILMSGYPIGEAEREIMPHEWIQKPVSAEVLAQVISQALNDEE